VKGGIGNDEFSIRNGGSVFIFRTYETSLALGPSYQ